MTPGNTILRADRGHTFRLLRTCLAHKPSPLTLRSMSSHCYTKLMYKAGIYLDTKTQLIRFDIEKKDDLIFDYMLVVCYLNIVVCKT